MRNILPVFIVLIVCSLAGCGPGNKDIPDPNDINVFINNIVGTVTDSTSGEVYSISMSTADTLSNDTLVSLGYDDVTQDEILFSIYHTEVGVFPVDLVPAGTAEASLLFRKKSGSGYRNYLMTSGNIEVTQMDTVAKRVKGKINVNNLGAITDTQYVIQADFNVKLNGN